MRLRLRECERRTVLRVVDALTREAREGFDPRVFWWEAARLFPWEGDPDRAAALQTEAWRLAEVKRKGVTLVIEECGGCRGAAASG